MNFTRIIKYILTFLVGLAVIFLVYKVSHTADNRSMIDISGKWDFQLDYDDQGVEKQWYFGSLSDKIILPNSTDVAGKGNKNGPVLAQRGRLTRDTEYVGAAWYQKEIDIPRAWIDKKIVLYLERAHWESRLWIDGLEIGMQESLSASHQYDLTGKIKPGKHRFTLRIDNRHKYNVGSWAHSVTDETMGNWNGVIGKMELRASEKIFIENIRIGNDTVNKKIWIDGKIGNLTLFVPKGHVRCVVRSASGEKVLLKQELELAKMDNNCTFLMEIPIEDKLSLWDEFHPDLYLAEVTLEAKNGNHSWSDTREITFGVRSLTTTNSQFLVNGRPTFMRGNLMGGEFPLTGHFPMQTIDWERVIRVHKSYGFNHIRFHSFCPPHAAFEAADKLGFYFQVEGPFWTHFTKDSPEGRFLKDEVYRMIIEYGNHPSFVMMGFGNEIGGDNPYFSSLMRELRQVDPRRLYTCDVNERPGGKRQTPIDDVDYFVSRHTPKGKTRLADDLRFVSINTVAGNDMDYSEAASGVTVPFIAHEIGFWAVHPSFKEIPKYQGVMKPYNLMFFKRLLDRNGLGDQAEVFSKASGMFSWQHYKEDMEACLRSPGFGGFHLLQLHDFPGQGDALVGMLDVFFETKGIVTPEQFKKVCSETVPLARMSHFVWNSDQIFEADIYVSHYGPEDLNNAKLSWRIVNDNGDFEKKGTIEKVKIKQGTVTSAGKITQSLSSLTGAAHMKLIIEIEGTSYSNEWSFWVYPEKKEMGIPSHIMFTDRYDTQVKEILDGGGTVLLSVPADADTDQFPRILRTSFKPVFWTALWRPTRHEATMGILCDPAHPALKEFPTDFHGDWQWAQLMNGGRAFMLSETPKTYRPIVQGIDDFHRGRKLGHIFEGMVGKGRIIVCGFDLHTDMKGRAVARQMLHSLIHYMGSKHFNPSQQIDMEMLFEPSLAQANRVMYVSHALHDDGKNSHEDRSDLELIQDELELFSQTVKTTIKQEGASALFDLNWSSDWIIDEMALPQEVQIDFGRTAKLMGVIYKPTMVDESRFIEFDVYLSNDKSNWGPPAGHYSAFPFMRQQPYRLSRYPYNVLFDHPCEGRYMKIVVTRGFQKGTELRIAEIEPLYIY